MTGWVWSTGAVVLGLIVTHDWLERRRDRIRAEQERRNIEARLGAACRLHLMIRETNQKAADAIREAHQEPDEPWR